MHQNNQNPLLDIGASEYGPSGMILSIVLFFKPYKKPDDFVEKITAEPHITH